MAIIIFQRRFQPAALVLALSSFILASTWILESRLDESFRWFAAAYAAAVGLLMLAAWIKNSQRALGYGYLASTGLWVFVSWVGWTGGLGYTSTLLALMWALLGAGSYLLEVRDGDGRWLP